MLTSALRRVPRSLEKPRDPVEASINLPNSEVRSITNKRVQWVAIVQWGLRKQRQQQQQQ